MTDIVSQFFSENFYSGFRITQIGFDQSGSIIIHLEPPEDYPQCPHCHARCTVVNQYRKRVVRDSSILCKKVILEVVYRTLRCTHCNRVGTEKIDFLSDNGFRVSRRLEMEVIEDLERAGSIKDTSERTGLKWDNCKDIHKYYLKSSLYFDLGDASILAIDEFSIRRGHIQATVVIDIRTRRVIWVGYGKSVAQVSDFFKKCGTEGCKQLKAVAMDQNAGFAKCVEKYCPNAKVVYDQFHLISNFGRMVISAIRIRLSNQCEENGNKDAASLLKGSNSLLLTRNSRLPDNRRTKFDDILKFYTDLNKANELNELLPEIFQSTSKEEAEKLWSAWYKLASESNGEEITKFAETQNENYKDGITNAGIYHIGTSVLEGINNKINVFKRVAFGFRDFDYFFLRIMDAFRGKPDFA